MTSLQDAKFYLKSLRSETCQCGKRKGVKKSFCHKCFGCLPGAMKRDLYKRMFDGYEQAYDAALKFLKPGQKHGCHFCSHLAVCVCE